MGVAHARASCPEFTILRRRPKLGLLILADVLPRLWFVDLVDNDVLVVPERVETEPAPRRRQRCYLSEEKG